MSIDSMFAEDSSNNVILALDIGSSSIRCSAYRVFEDQSNDQQPQLDCMGHVSRQLQAVEPDTGRIRGSAVLDTADLCLAECLHQLRSTCSSAATGTIMDRTSCDKQAGETCSGSEGFDAFTVVAVGISSFVMNLIGINHLGEYIGDQVTLSYACNTVEVARDVVTLQSTIGADVWRDTYQKTGAPLHVAYALPQLRVLYNDNSALVSQERSMVARFTTLASVLVSKWTLQQNLPISYSEASWTGLINVRTCTYNETLLRLLPDACVSALPSLADFDQADIPSGIPEDSPYYSQWPELRQCRWFLGVGDGACANIGSKCTVPYRIACTVGTSAAARIVLEMPLEADPERDVRGRNDDDESIRDVSYDGHDSQEAADLQYLVVPPGLFCYRINRNYCLLGGALTDGGSVIEWLSKLLNIPSNCESFQKCMREVEEMVLKDLEMAPSSTLESGSLLTIPFLSGERSTGYRTGTTGAIVGLTRNTTPAHLFKTFMEGVTLRIAAIVSLLCQLMPPGKMEACLVASGKALEANSMWRQMISDCTGLPVIFDETTQDATSRGMVFLVLRSVQVRSCGGLPLEQVQTGLESFPRPQARGYWREKSATQEKLIHAIYPL